MAQVPHIVTGDPADPKARISISLDGRFRSFLIASEQGRKLYDAVKSGADLEEVRLIASVEAWAVAKNFNIAGKTLVLDDRDQLRLNGKVVDYGLTGIIKRMAEAGEDIEPLVNFMERVEQNPNKSVANDLYRFLSKGALPLTPEGQFHAYKRVDASLNSIHSGREPTWTQLDGEEAVESTGKTSYPIGGTVWMRREDCDENRNVTCSRGLHACSFDYLQSFGGQKIINVLIDPADVTAIPNDYNDAKLRCCRLRVLAEIPEEDAREYFSHVVDRRFAAVANAPNGDEVAPDGTEDSPSEAPVDYAAKGREAGEEGGKLDRENDYQYHPAPEFPCEIDEDCDPQLEGAELNDARVAFSQGYFEGYASGWNSVDEASEDDEAEEESSTPLTVELAKQFGAEDGGHDAEQDHSHSYGYDNDHENGQRWESVQGYGDDSYDPEEGAETAYQIAYHAAYSAKWAELNP